MSKLLKKLKSRLIILEGPDGSGKTTLGDSLVELFRSQGLEVVRTFEPGGTPFSNSVRELALKAPDEDKPSPKTQMLAMFTSRYNHWEKVIKPSLERGAIVVCDRFVASTYAYQAVNIEPIELGIRLFNQLDEAGQFDRGYTLFIDCDFPTKSKRRGEVYEDDMDLMFNSESKFNKMRTDLQEFLRIYRHNSWSSIDSSNLTPEQVVHAALNELTE